MNTKQIVFALVWLLPMTAAAQSAPMVTMDEEPHHHLVLKNDIVKVYAIDLEPHDGFLMHRHDRDDIAIVLRDATTVNTSPGQADVLTISKTGDVRFSRSPRVHSVRNIGHTPYSIISVDLLQDQTGARNLCGKQVPDSPPNCPAASADANAPRLDVPQFETDQTRVTLTRIRPREQATFGEAERDVLIVTIDSAEPSAAAGPAKGPDDTPTPGKPMWLARGAEKRILKNNSDKELRVVTVAFKP